MHRRDFLKTTGTVLAGATLADGAMREVSAQSGAAPATGRMILPINRNWRYNHSVTAAAHERNFDDSAFKSEVLPHTNIELTWHSFEDKSY